MLNVAGADQMQFRHVAFCCSLLSALVLAACDAAPGAEDASSAPPVISDLQYTPELLVLAALPPADVTEDSVRFDLSFSVQAEDPEDELRSVVFSLRSPDPQAPAAASGTIDGGTGGTYGSDLGVWIPRGDVGNYTLSIFALDETGRMSNTLRGTITFTAEGRPPVITEVIADPDTVLVTRDSILTLTAVVEDPDGIDNIARVIVRVPNGAEVEMVDDGVRFGDPVAGDGRYYARFENVNLATPNTTQTFRFQAFDKTGLASAIVEKPVRVE